MAGKPKPLPPLRGRLFGRLRVIEFAERRALHDCWLCRCVCGRELVVRRNHLLSGNTQSCGSGVCTNRGKHGGRKFREWTPEEDALHGTMPDGDVAKAVGVSIVTARKRRVRLGIPSFGSRKNTAQIL